MEGKGLTCSGTESTAVFKTACSPKCRAMFTAKPYSYNKEMRTHRQREKHENKVVDGYNINKNVIVLGGREKVKHDKQLKIGKIVLRVPF